MLDLDETSKAPTRCRAQQKVSQSANPSQALLSLKEHSRVSPQLSQHFSIKHWDTNLRNILSQTGPTDTRVIPPPRIPASIKQPQHVTVLGRGQHWRLYLALASILNFIYKFKPNISTKLNSLNTMLRPHEPELNLYFQYGKGKKFTNFNCWLHLEKSHTTASSEWICIVIFSA